MNLSDAKHNLASLLLGGILTTTPLHPTAAVEFTKIVLDREFRSEGVALADLDGDGDTDVLAGSCVYLAPDWQRRSIRPVKPFDGTIEYSDCFYQFAMDVDGDGDIDSIIVEMMGQRCLWYANPGHFNAPWQEHVAWPSVNNECPVLIDLFENNSRVLVFASQPEAQFAWFSPGESALTTPWTMHPISMPGAPGTDRYTHGMGIGDMNGDGLKDLLIRDGWWEQPREQTAQAWVFHPVEGLGPDCAHMLIDDLDGDGDADVVSSSAHGYGIWWYEQVQSTPTSFVQHPIKGDISQNHALQGADINQDGIADFVTGKRYLAHMGRDPGANEPAAVYWFEGRRDNGRFSFIPHLIDDASGVGTQFEIGRIDGNPKPDIAVSNKNGVFLFTQGE